MSKTLNNNQQMTLMSHLDEFRKKLFYIVLVNLITIGVCFNYTEQLMWYLLELANDMNLIYISPSELFMVYVQLAFIAGMILASPITMYLIWSFVKKGLYPREKKYIIISLFVGLICFIIGVYFCYKTLLPITIGFFNRIAIDEISAMISIQSYTSFVNMMLLGCGVVFEMPVLIYLLTQLNVIKPHFLMKHRGILIIAIFVCSAFITPPDVVSQLMLSIPMMLLLELSIMISKFVYNTNLKRELKENK